MGTLLQRIDDRHLFNPRDLRQVTLGPVSIEGNRATMSGSTTIDRRDFGVGGGDGDDLISRQITLTIRVVATRAG